MSTDTGRGDAVRARTTCATRPCSAGSATAYGGRDGGSLLLGRVRAGYLRPGVSGTDITNTPGTIAETGPRTFGSTPAGYFGKSSRPALPEW
jgi:hypothetical protein